MRLYRRFAVQFPVAVALALAACAEPAPAPKSAPPGARADAPWFLCDALNAQRVIVARTSAGGERALITEYQKPGAEPLRRADYELGEPEGATGHVETPLQRDGAVLALVRAINIGMLEQPGSAYTPPVRAVAFGSDAYQCRWLPRTRLIGFSETRTYVIHEDADGDLIYTAYDFADQLPDIIELSDNGRSTPFSTEVRGGTEVTGPVGSEFRFESGDDLYLVVAPNEGPATTEYYRGETLGFTEVMIAQQLGIGPEE